MAHEVVQLGDFAVSLWLHSTRDVPRADWTRALGELDVFMRTRSIPVARLRSLVISDGGAPDSLQRAQFRSEIARGRSSKLSVVTTVLANPVKRGVATAVMWMNPATRFFVPSELEAALEHLDLRAWRADLGHRFTRLAQWLPPNRTLLEAAPLFED